MHMRPPCMAGRMQAKVRKGVRWMPRLQKAMKDVASCEKPGVGAGDL